MNNTQSNLLTNQPITELNAVAVYADILKLGFTGNLSQIIEHAESFVHFTDEQKAVEELNAFGRLKAEKFVSNYEMSEYGDVCTNIKNNLHLANSLFKILGELKFLQTVISTESVLSKNSIDNNNNKELIYNLLNK